MRKIIHIDMDAFFAAVEMRDNPALRNVPMAVGGSSDRRGVLSTSNYLARKFGVRSAMATAYAMKLCPQLVLVKPNFRKYSEASEKVFEIFHQYTDLVEGLSMDEAYLDVTNVDLHNNSATLIAQEIRQKIFEATQLTASAGISSNKLIAKLSSDFKKPNGQYTVTPDKIPDFIKVMPVEIATKVKYTPMNYINHIQKEYEWCDVIIARSGASTVSELAIIKKPVLIFPFPQATDNHQFFNAQIFKEESDFTVEVLDPKLPHDDAVKRTEEFLVKASRGELKYSSKPALGNNTCDEILREIKSNVGMA